jgi:tRNA (guanine37-N1)-methyltransferase
MRFDVVTIFPGIFSGPLSAGVLGKARSRGRFEIAVHDLRDFADPPHRNVDDEPYGGGAGMVFRLEPLWRAAEALRAPGLRAAVVRPTPSGELLTQALVRELGEYEQVVTLCDRYEGADARVQAVVTHEVCLGDFVLTGGELVALVLIEAVVRALEGVVGDEESVRRDSFASGLLDHRSYTRPAAYRGLAVPDVIASGHHGRVEAWRRRDALRQTLERRPDLLDGAPLRPGDREILTELRAFGAEV